MSENKSVHVEAYSKAQKAMAELKSAVLAILNEAPEAGLQNAEIGRMLGIYAGHIGHEGHISRTILEMLSEEGVAIQDTESKKWKIKENSSE